MLNNQMVSLYFDSDLTKFQFFPTPTGAGTGSVASGSAAGCSQWQRPRGLATLGTNYGPHRSGWELCGSNLQKLGEFMGVSTKLESKPKGCVRFDRIWTFQKAKTGNWQCTQGGFHMIWQLSPLKKNRRNGKLNWWTHYKPTQYCIIYIYITFGVCHVSDCSLIRSSVSARLTRMGPWPTFSRDGKWRFGIFHDGLVMI